MKFEYAYSSSSRWVDTSGKNSTMGDKMTVLTYARDHGWELIAIAEGTMYFKREWKPETSSGTVSVPV